MFCKNCGKENNENIKFCNICGEEVIDVNFSNIYMENRNEKKNFKEKYKKKIKGTVISIVSVFVVLIVIGIFSESDKYIDLVKNGKFYAYPDVSVGKAFEEFFEDSEWKHFVSEDNENIVEFTGEYLYNDSDVEGLIQFVVNDDNSFEVEYFSMNDITQDAYMVDDLIYDVMAEY